MGTDDSEPNENNLPHNCWNLSDSEKTIGKTKDEFEKFFAYWSRAEDVAMHFNQLILNLRLKALGGIFVGGVLLTAALKHDGTFHPGDWWALATFFGASLVIWISVWCIDRKYYCHLLRGAVNEIERLEAMSNGRVLLSLSIEHAVATAKAGKNELQGDTWWSNKQRSSDMTNMLIKKRDTNNGDATRHATRVFYGLPCIMLLILCAVSISKAKYPECETIVAITLILPFIAVLCFDL